MKVTKNNQMSLTGLETLDSMKLGSAMEPQLLLLSEII
jgi:hypothetical protein